LFRLHVNYTRKKSACAKNSPAVATLASCIDPAVPVCTDNANLRLLAAVAFSAMAQRGRCG
jgi:hypothetical protein